MNAEKYAGKRKELLLKCRRLIAKRDLINLEILKLRNEMKCWDNYLLYGDDKSESDTNGKH